MCSVSDNFFKPGPSLARAMRIGTRVVRGEDWNCGNHDGPPPGEGTITTELNTIGLVQVRWDNGLELNYRMGYEGKYDLKLANRLPVQQKNSFSESVDEKDSTFEEHNLPAVLEEIVMRNQRQTPLGGPELAQAMKIGTRVVKGVDWEWGNEDGPPPGKGTIIRKLRKDGWIKVKWDTGFKKYYRMGGEGKYDLKLANPIPAQQRDSFPDSVEENDSTFEEHNLPAVLEEIVMRNQRQTPLGGPELAQAMKIGTRVVKGVDWEWGNEDGPPPGKGTIIRKLRKDGWIKVKWDTGFKKYYRMGGEGKYDLKLANPIPAQQRDSFPDSVEENAKGPIMLPDSTVEEYNLQTVLEEIYMGNQSQTPLSGPELIQAMKIGTRVVKGVDWEWGNEDGPPPGKGTIIRKLRKDGWIKVKWDTGFKKYYRMGGEGKYDLKLANPIPAQQRDSFPDSVEENEGPNQDIVPGEQFIAVMDDALLDDILKRNQSQSHLSGPKLAQAMKIGNRVVRGVDWEWGNEDGLPPGKGTIIEELSKDGWISVMWDTKFSYNYRMGHHGKYDLKLCHTLPSYPSVKRRDSFSYSVEQEAQSRDSTRTVQNVEQSTSELPECIICLSNKRDVVFHPCGHLVACKTCADDRIKYCIMCRKYITSKINTYIS